MNLLHSVTTFLLIFVDPILGRVNKESLSAKTMLEIFASGIENMEIFTPNFSIPDDLRRCPGVRLGATREIEELSWDEANLRGTIDLQWIPSVFRRVYMCINELSGTLDLTSLEPPLTHLDLHENHFSGEVSLGCLPGTMRHLNLMYNNFTGTVDLEHLPEPMETLMLNNNKFSGSVILNKLPPSMQEIYLSTNLFSGSIDLFHLPDTMHYVTLQNNNFSGEIVFEDFSLLPQVMRGVNLGFNSEAGGKNLSSKWPGEITSYC
uniref:Leucine-rich repeat protein n=1 Tax=Paramoeba aestuarina TaxID=180227 RepID=A0A7S4L213_9EUKA|mmetsp:Transcript_29670/g.45844  ORF Transcript_29670/g.45844 Transcript_29670/m.45844 type:complete len:263 (+) Transcript_29670:23-811(+)